MRAAGDSDYARVLNAGDVNIADGLPIAWTMGLRGTTTERIAGTEGVALLCDAAEKARLRTISMEARRIRSRDCAPSFDGSTRAFASQAPSRRASASRPRRSSPRLLRRSERPGPTSLWIGVGTPTQHYVASRLRELDAAPVILCVGAAFDFVAGTKKRAPKWMQRSGLEWLHRMLSEPRRLCGRYLKGNPKFVAGVAREWLHDVH